MLLKQRIQYDIFRRDFDIKRIKKQRQVKVIVMKMGLELQVKKMCENL